MGSGWTETSIERKVVGGPPDTYWNRYYINDLDGKTYKWSQADSWNAEKGEYQMVFEEDRPILE
ncbi:MAG: hypothetical protein Nk1A_6560 [Endomicrobiia bacterium]|nr:MAG: hypothetical protein Nk1A_6560 [Endomicrobiia bacterium]